MWLNVSIWHNWLIISKIQLCRNSSFTRIFHGNTSHESLHKETKWITHTGTGCAKQGCGGQLQTYGNSKNQNVHIYSHTITAEKKLRGGVGGARGGVPNPERSWESHLAWASVQFSCSVVSDSLQPHEPQHARPPCPSPTPGVHPNPCPLSRWCHPTISSSVIPFSNRRGYFSKVTILSNISSYTDPG